MTPAGTVPVSHAAASSRNGPAPVPHGPSTAVRIIPPYASQRLLRVRAAHEGMTLLDFFSKRFPYLSQEEWHRRIVEGWILLERDAAGESGADPATPLRAGQRIRLLNDEVIEPAVPADVPVIQSSPDWLVVHKPAPLPIHSGGRYFRNTLLGILEDLGWSGLHPVHRLDSVTSGLICLARTPSMADQLAAAFTSGRAVKGYLALVAGHPSEDAATVSEPIRRKSGFVFECGRDLQGLPEPKPAETRLEVVERLNSPDGPVSIVRCLPITGRTHQLRLHLRAWGHPIVDDPIYGPDGDDSGATLQNRSISLQSSQLMIPGSGIDASLDIPASWMG
jgi:RluA family pseudouridine synthase